MSKIIPNSFQYPNYYSDELMWLLSGDEQKVLLYTVRRILGFHKEKDNISLSQYTDGLHTKTGEVLDYGTGLNRPAVISAIEMLVACGIIVEIPESHSQAGKCYALQLDSDKINLQPLHDRRDARHQIGQRRTEKARQSAKQVVSGTDHPVVSETDQRGSVGLTTGSQSDLPEVVSGTDTQNKVETQKETKGKEAPPVLVEVTPDGITDALEEIYPGHAPNFRTIRQMYDLAVKLNATAADVRKFPVWLQTNHPKKADSPFAFLDLFNKSLPEKKPSQVHGNSGAVKAPADYAQFYKDAA